MNRKTAWLITPLLLAWVHLAEAQPPKKVARLGELLFREGPALGAGREVFRRALRDLGYVEGKNVTFETRSANGKLDQFPTLAHELVRLKVDVLVASSTTEAQARTIPIVFIISSDPVADRLVDSLAHTPWRKHHRNHYYCNGLGWQTIRVAQGIHS